MSDTAEDATYYFHATDGNCTAIRRARCGCKLGAELSGEFIKSDTTDSSVYFTWDEPSWTATLDDKPYTKVRGFAREGTYHKSIFRDKVCHFIV